MAVWKHRAGRVLHEPIFHFFVAGVLLFLAHRWIAGDSRVVVVTPGVRAELSRSFQDNRGRPPAPDELEAEVRTWQRDEALARQAKREGLDRNDRTIRTVLADHLRARVAQGIPNRQPTAADLDAWLAAHRGDYETPRRYDYQVIAFPRSPAGAAELAKIQRALASGVDARTLGRPLVGGNLTAPELAQRLGAGLAAHVQTLPIGKWDRVETEQESLLVRVVAVSGGLPPASELRPRLFADWQYAQHQHDVDEALRDVVGRYRFEERR
ncbi:MAG TPA: peptidyl-prolyl cis-trans isomerase [Polyangia bacterium]|nr:peptidyl-prolyl cis-trans isomerase [Polyangia bacterium]